ncbi:hypothetical protein PJK55_05825 [Exiguobacterium sp. MMG028]|uniref:hypothetical protein n=1 Tax=Exiguobacterium sp. MMG028 TaxID=3021979 RepID=UPI0022FEE045|nr:hypothetical protein [Exiguobacterium sp. MMG028]MDA5560249.1 hypothetical protein [Exiguobacterium sp. MMG028]
MLSGCTDDTEAVPEVEEVVQEMETNIETTPDAPATSEPKETSEPAIRLQSAGESESIGEVESYDLSLFFADQAPMIAPEHITDNQIVYTELIEESSSQINVYDTEHHTNDNIYTSSKTIGNLVGIQDEVFWIEYAPAEGYAYEWSLFKMSLSELKPEQLAEGVSRFETPVPYVTASEDAITWVNYEASASDTKTTVMQFSPMSDSIQTIEAFTLQEEGKRDGEYIFDYRSGEEAIILHKSIFNEGNLTSRLITTDGSFDEEVSALIDFERGSKFVSLGIEGRVEFLSTTPSPVKYTYNGSQKNITFDAFRYLRDDYILFREGMNRLLIADLKEETVSYLPNDGGTLSKPIFKDGKVAYAEFEGEGLVRFYVIDVK